MDEGRATRRRKLLGIAASGLAASFSGCSGVLDRKDDHRDDAGNGDTDSSPVSKADLTDSPPYRSYHYGGRHTGHTDVAGPKNDVKPHWTLKELPKERSYEPGTPAVEDGTAYVAEGYAPGEFDEGIDPKTHVYALDVATGEIQWRHETDRRDGPGSTSIAGDTVVQPVAGSLIGLDAATGEKLWSTDIDVKTPVTTTDDDVYVVAGEEDAYRLVVLDSEDGSTRRTVPIRSDRLKGPAAPAVADETVYLAGDRLRALTVGDTTEHWSRLLLVAASDAPTVTDDAVYVPLWDGTILAVDRQNGEQLWSERVPTNVTGAGQRQRVASPAVSDGTVYVINGAQLTAFDAVTGEQLWTDESVGRYPPTATDDTVYVAGYDVVRAHDAATGEDLWFYLTDARTNRRTVPVVLDGMVLVGSGELLALVEDPEAE